MKTHLRITFALLFFLVIALSACDSHEPDQPVEVIQRTKPPFEPRNFTQTAEFDQTATAEVLATQMIQTAQAEATLQAQFTATAAARESEIIAYQYYEPFAENTLEWREAVEDNPFWQGSIAIEDGVYTWQIDSVAEIFLAWSFFKPDEDLADFDVALTARRTSGTAHETCYGLLFRTSPEGFSAGSYVLTVCDNGYYKLLYTDSEEGWDVLQDWTHAEAIRGADWNLIEVSAQGADFTVLINHQLVTTFTDSRLASGRVAILIDIYGKEPGQIEFDFFALQPR